MLSVRTKLGYPQSKMGAILGIADRSYKNYELEKRELPLSIAVKFCDEFEQNLGWLVFGHSAPDTQTSIELVGKTTREVVEYCELHEPSPTSEEIQKFAEYIFEQAITKSSTPEEEAKQFFTAIGYKKK